MTLICAAKSSSIGSVAVAVVGAAAVVVVRLSAVALGLLRPPLDCLDLIVPTPLVVGKAEGVAKVDVAVTGIAVVVVVGSVDDEGCCCCDGATDGGGAFWPRM